jgi:hypothetical protein
MQLEFTKVIITAVVAEREDGKTIGERTTEPVTFYTQEQIIDFLPKLEQEIAAENAKPELEPAKEATP